MASQILIFDNTFTDGGNTSFLYYNGTRSASASPHTTQYFNVDNVIHNNLIGMNSIADSSGSFVGNRYYERSKADLSSFNEVLIGASKTTSNSHLIYISLVGYESDWNILVNSVPQTEYPVSYPIPIEFVGFMGEDSDSNWYNTNYASGFKSVQYYTETSNYGNYHITYNDNTYNYSSSTAWHNNYISLSSGQRNTYYLCTSLTLKNNYYVWSTDDSISFDIVLYVFTNLANSSTGFPWTSTTIRNQGTVVPNYTTWKYKEYVLESHTLGTGESWIINTSSIVTKLNSSSPGLKSGVNVYFGHGQRDSCATTNKFAFTPAQWGIYINNGTGALTDFISSHVCTTSNIALSRTGMTFSHDHMAAVDRETCHFCNIPVVIQGTKTQETGSGGSNPVFYSIGFIGLKNVIYNIGISSTQHWYNPLPNDAITYYKYLCLEKYNPSEYNGWYSVSSANSYFMVNNNGQHVYAVSSYNHAYIQGPNANFRDAVILTSYSGGIYSGGGSGYGSGGGY